ncbi:MAG: PIN domain-containing protein [Firmicutes bacterium]|nr:PIN domain-containing protein [Bacillota bacterium]MCL5039884.1 PIN domain-containing protein [Bacillota bacterium]
MILIDTNVWVYAINVDAPQNGASRRFIETVVSTRHEGVIMPQILLEFYAIVTDKRRIALPLTSEQALEQMKVIRSLCRLVDAGGKGLENLSHIMAGQPGLKGAKIFDAYLVAQMMVAGINRICTYNTHDFKVFKGITPLTPEELLEIRGIRQ